MSFILYKFNEKVTKVVHELFFYICVVIYYVSLCIYQEENFILVPPIHGGAMEEMHVLVTICEPSYYIFILRNSSYIYFLCKFLLVVMIDEGVPSFDMPSFMICLCRMAIFFLRCHLFQKIFLNSFAFHFLCLVSRYFIFY